MSSPPLPAVVGAGLIASAAVATGAAIGLGQSLIAAGVAVLVVTVALLGDLERAGKAFVVVGFGAVAMFSDRVAAGAAVQGSSVRLASTQGLGYALLVVGLLLLLIAPTGRRPVPWRMAHLLIAGYLLCAALGAATNPERELFLVRWAQVSLPFAAVAMLWRRGGSTRWLVGAVLLAAAAHVGAATYALVTGREYLGAADIAGEAARLGGSVHPVLLAFAAACIAAWALWRVLSASTQSAVGAAAVMALAAIILGYSRGRTGFLAAAAMGACVLVVVGRRRGARAPDRTPLDRRRFLLLGVTLLLVVFSSAIVGWFVRGEASELRTLTNRTRLWSATVDLVQERPLVGWGPGLLRSGAVAERVEARAGFVGHAHNALLDATLAAGLVGGGLWFAGFLATGTALFRTRAQVSEFSAFVPCLWVGCLVFGITEGNLSGFGLSWLLFLALTASLPTREHERARR